jgi:hypothetical protein
MSLLGSDGLPISAIHIRDMQLIDREALPGLPQSMEARLYAPNSADDQPCIVLVNRLAELHVAVPLTEWQTNLMHYVNALNVAVAKQAMGETPDNEEGYRIDDHL